jgi:hypothetical protein
MEKIIIKIPDNLTPEEERFAIFKKMGKALAPPKKKQLAIGEGYIVQQLQTEIVIVREPVVKLTVVHECSVCKTLFEPVDGFKLYVNYGGITRERLYCSNSCREVVIGICGEGRASKTKGKLKPIRLF